MCVEQGGGGCTKDSGFLFVVCVSPFLLVLEALNPKALRSLRGTPHAENYLSLLLFDDFSFFLRWFRCEFKR